MRCLILLCLALGFCADGFGERKKSPTQLLAQGDSAFTAGNYLMAIPLYESALKDPKIAAGVTTWFRLGASYHNLKDYPRTLAAYARAEKINAKLPGLHLSMARAFSASGDLANANLQLDSAVRNGFGNYKFLDQHPEFENFRKSAGFLTIREKVLTNAYPCRAIPAARAFDFWLGEWDVHQTSNPAVKVGTNRITSQSGGCVLLESWESQSSHQGVSVNYFDPVKGKWQQKWAGSGQDIIEFYDGEYKEGWMQFKWDGRNPDGTPFPGRLTFTRLESGQVRQHSQRSNDGGNTWVDVYDFTYTLKK